MERTCLEYGLLITIGVFSIVTLTLFGWSLIEAVQSFIVWRRERQR